MLKNIQSFKNFHNQDNLNNSISLINISHQYQGADKFALNSISLTINQGDIFFITGVSGAGKSTLLSIISGLIKPTSGIVRIGDPNIFMGEIFQDLKLIEDLTAWDNLELVFDSNIYRTRTEFDKDVVSISKILDANEYLSKKINNMNGGMKQKIAIIRAMLCQPDVVIADEPTSSMDKKSANQVFELLNFYNNKRKMTIVWATHSRDLIRQYPGKVTHLDQGRIVYSGHACFI